jgi:SAM-dependent methyltransferase
VVRPGGRLPAPVGRIHGRALLHAANALALARDAPLRPEAPRATEGARLSTTAKYDPQAAAWSRTAYADPAGYLGRRAELVETLGPALDAGDVVLDLACGDAGQADPLLARGLAYVGVDASEAMVEAARARLAGRADVHLADLNEFAPAVPVAATTIFRAIYHGLDRCELFRRIAGYTAKKVVFDLNPRQYRLEDVRADLVAAGWNRLDVRPFFCPQRVVLPPPLRAVMRRAEELGPLARLLLRFRFSYLCSASRS